MAVVAIYQIKRFLGLSTDAKPTDGIPAGSEFFETNTGQKWIYDGTNWIEDIALIYALTQAHKEPVPTI